MKISAHTIQGVGIELHCDERLHSRVAHYLDFFYKGDALRLIKPVLYELSIAEAAPAIPAGAVRVINAPDVSCYKDGNNIYYASNDGSLVHLDSSLRKITGYLREKVLEHTITLYGLIGAPFSEILKLNSLYTLHSAALCRNGVGYLFSGNSGSGKTTTTLGLVCNGFQYVSDDSLVLEEINGEITAHSLTKTFNVDRDLAERFPAVVNKQAVPSNGNKMLVHIEQIITDSFVPRIRPDVIIFLKILSDRQSRIQPLKQMDVFRKLLGQTVLAADNDVSQDQIQTLGMLARQVRGYELLSGGDIYKDPGILVDLINGTGCQNADN